ncbi:MAG: hypothetical protein FD180_2539 [Planctomycetota bacterium]|nr:MAG: hypothetical protein FD180_2539 [Planctomycetota bacterium]
MPELPLNYVFEPLRFWDRAKAYGSCAGGRRFAVAHQTPGTTITGQTSFVATTPTFLIRQASAEHRVVLSNFALCQAGTAAGDLIHILVAIDTSDRYSSGGTLITPQATAAPSSLAAGFTFRYNPTASSAGGGTRYLYEWTQAVYSGGIFNPDMHDGVLIGFTGSILVYTWAATTAPTWVIGGFDVMEDE